MSYYNNHVDNNHVAGFDTLGAAKQLEESGLPRKPAETIVEVFNDGLASVVGQLATKADLQTTEATLKGQIGDLRGHIGGLEGKIGGLEGQIGDLRGHIGSLEGKIGDLKGSNSRFAYTILGLMIALEVLPVLPLLPFWPGS